MYLTISLCLFYKLIGGIVTGLFMGWIHIHHQPYSNPCVDMSGHWALLSTPLYRLCPLGIPSASSVDDWGTQKPLFLVTGRVRFSFEVPHCFSQLCLELHNEWMWLQVVLGTLLAALVPVVGFNAVMTSEHFASFLVGLFLISAMIDWVGVVC